MTKIFVSYRRDDSAGYTGRLIDKLDSRFGSAQIFRDIDDIEPGSDFVKAIDRAVGSCDILLAVIGTQWLSISDAQGAPRLHDPNDFVRLEVATALARNVRVIPVLVRGAQMPRANDLPDDLKVLSRRNAMELSDVRWDYDVDRLVTALERIQGAPSAKTSTAKTRTAKPGPRPAAVQTDKGPGGCLETFVIGASFLVPAVGIIAGLVFLFSDNAAKKRAGKRWLIIAVAIVVFWMVVVSVIETY